ncbi:MAG: amino acid permease [Elusimicrobia bacterium GWA2_56_46]|nr:MAG: amino acid permease [Elusimicrobia bacterium GWA2_56_46]OGR54473.1 MAG: amino acid permease [Elusimicrobia bacterium GWC2_56_31]HBB66722.1 amino acid permease [Elusimicrobiota bacterium]HBW22547.1 amino acid permease [Elusimicrobiota bacterium]
MKALFRKKSLTALMTQAEEKEHSLKRVLGPLNLTLLGIGGIIGAGIFVLTGQAAAQYAGPAIVLSFIISAVGCAFAGLCYAEFASMIPIAGSAYTYSYATIGELLAWIIGWDLILEYLFGAATVSVGWSGYVVSFLRDFGVNIPAALSQAPFAFSHSAGWTSTGAVMNLPAVFIIAAVTGLLVVGISESAKVNDLAVAAKVIVIILFIVFGVAHVNSANWHPFIPENTGVFGQFGWSGIARGAGVIFFAYIGFDAVSTAAQEAKNPQRDMPIGILASLVVCTILYILVALVLTGIVKYDRLLVPDPIAVGVDAAGPALFWLRKFIKVGAIAGLSSVMLVLLLGQPRIFYAMSLDGLLPPLFSKVHPRFRTPHITTVVTGSVAALLGGLFPIGALGEMVSIGTLLAFAIVCVSILVLRKSHPELKRPFKTPLVPLVPVLGAVISLAQMAFLPWATWLRLIAWMAIGASIYFLYGRHNSKLAPLKPDDWNKEPST